MAKMNKESVDKLIQYIDTELQISDNSLKKYLCGKAYHYYKAKEKTEQNSLDIKPLNQ